MVRRCCLVARWKMHPTVAPCASITIPSLESTRSSSTHSRAKPLFPISNRGMAPRWMVRSFRRVLTCRSRRAPRFDLANRRDCTNSTGSHRRRRKKNRPRAKAPARRPPLRLRLLIRARRLQLDGGRRGGEDQWPITTMMRTRAAAAAMTRRWWPKAAGSGSALPDADAARRRRRRRSARRRRRRRPGARH